MSPRDFPIATEYDLTERDVIHARFWFLRHNKAVLALGALAVVVLGGYTVWAWICGRDLVSLLPFGLLLAFWIGFLPLATDLRGQSTRERP